MSENGKVMTSPADISRFVMAGNARLTLSSIKTGARYTFRVRASDDGKVHFVSVLTGSDNESNYTYLGIVRQTVAGPVFGRTAKSKIGADAPSHVAFQFFWQRVVLAGSIPASLEVRHEGACGRCGRALTVPESIDLGIGPDCAEKMGI